jgi:LPXTG-motif cell wall-anchored protein
MKRFAALLVGLALMVAPSAGFAATSQCQTYGSETCNVTKAAGTLPFTGINAAWLVLVGGGLLGAGLAVRRVSRDRI